jgi:hypothetical protein
MAAEASLASLARELSSAAALAPIMVRPAVEASTQQVLESWRASYRTIRSKPKIADALGSDVWNLGTVVMGEVGINKGRRKRGGAFAHILEFGSVNNPARNDGGEALLRATPGFFAAVTAASAGLLAGRAPAPSLQTTNPARFNRPPVLPAS